MNQKGSGRPSRGLAGCLLLAALLTLWWPSLLAAPAGAPLLTAQERAWLAAHPRIRVAPDPDFPPVEFFDEAGDLQGMAADYLRAIERQLGIHFEIVRLDNWQQVLQQAQARRVDMFGAAGETPQRRRYMAFTRPHIRLPGVILTTRQGPRHLALEDLRNKRVVVVAGYMWHDLLSTEYPGIELETAPDTAAALQILSFAQADAMVGDAATATWFIERQGITNLRVAGTTERRVELALAYRNDWPLLGSILQKGLDSIGAEEAARIRQRWIHLEHPSLLESRTFWLSLLGATVLFGWVLMWNRVLKRQVAKRTQALREELSRRRQAERALAAHLGQLEELVDLRTEALRKSEENFRRIFETMQDAYFFSDMDGRLRRVNPAAARMLGYDDERMLLDKNMARDVYKDPQDRVRMRRILLKEGRISNLEVPMRKRDGAMIVTQANSNLVLNADGRPQGIEGIVRDITESKQAERALRQAKEMAEAATEARTRFLANMSHEIRTPMNGIIGFTNLALRSELTAQQRDYLTKIQVSANSLLNLINDILDFSKIEAGKLHIERIGFALPKVLEELGDLFAGQAAGKDIELIFVRSPAAPTRLLGDPLRLRQVLVNLVSNAIKFTEQGEILVRVERSATFEDAVRLRFGVRDSGIGIAPEQLQDLFSSFTQADGSTTRKYGGTGLGLSICKQLVELMGGRIGADSRPGEGSEFWFELPFGLQSAPTEVAPRKRPLAGTRILVADDNDTSRQVLSEMLESLGLEAQTCASGNEALAAVDRAQAEDRPYGLVLLDWKMPGIDGLETARRLREDPGNARLPVIMVTAFGRDEEMRRGERIGIDAFLTKPLQQSVLFDTLLEVLYRQNPETPRTMVTPQRGGTTDIQGAEVLLAEDNLINQELAVNLLQDMGVRVTVANNGLEAVEALRHRQFDLVLMDMQMPKLDGYQATLKIREDNRLEQLPIVAMTAHAMAGDRERCLAAGTNDYLSKPVDPDRLLELLEKWIRPRRRRAGPACAAPTHQDRDGRLPERLAGFDLEQGVRRLRGNRSLYLKLLRDFARDHAGDAAALETLVAAGDPERARVLAHNLKGLAGNLSALELQRAAAALEAKLRDGEPEPTRMEPDIQRLHATLAAAITAVREVIGSAKADAATAEQPAGPPLTPESAARIRASIAMGDLTGVQDLVAALPPGTSHRAELLGLLQSFDLEGLQRLAERLATEAPDTDGTSAPQQLV